MQKIYGNCERQVENTNNDRNLSQNLLPLIHEFTATFR